MPKKASLSAFILPSLIAVGQLKGVIRACRTCSASDFMTLIATVMMEPLTPALEGRSPMDLAATGLAARRSIARKVLVTWQTLRRHDLVIQLMCIVLSVNRFMAARIMVKGSLVHYFLSMRRRAAAMPSRVGTLVRRGTLLMVALARRSNPVFQSAWPLQTAGRAVSGPILKAPVYLAPSAVLSHDRGARAARCPPAWSVLAAAALAEAARRRDPPAA